MSVRLCLLVASLVAFASLASSSLAGQATPKATLQAEVHDLQSGDLVRYYALLSPAFHKSCPFATFRPTGQQEERQLRGATLRVLAENIVGSRAYLTYEFLRGGIVLGKASRDLYVNVDGKWFDEVDKYTTC